MSPRSTMVSTIPAWAKAEAKTKYGGFVGIEVGRDYVELAVAAKGQSLGVARRFSPQEYEQAPDGCWREVFEALAQRFS